MRPVSVYMIIVLLMIPILAVITYFDIKRTFSPPADLSASQTDLPKIDDALNQVSIGENSEFLEFADSDSKLRLRYGSSWIKMEGGALKEAQKKVLDENEEVLLMLYKVNLANLQPAYLIVERVDMGSWEEIMGTMQKDAEANSQSMEIVKSDLSDNRVSVEIRYAPKDGKTGIASHEKEQILVDGNKSYIISASTTEKNWSSLEQEIDDIMGSVIFNPSAAAPDGNGPKPEAGATPGGLKENTEP